jgi:hypothetical protein
MLLTFERDDFREVRRDVAWMGSLVELQVNISTL